MAVTLVSRWPKRGLPQFPYAMSSPERTIMCAACGCRADADSEEQAEASGWLVDRASERRRYICPACREAARGY
jgi:hypothetical protein